MRNRIIYIVLDVIFVLGLGFNFLSYKDLELYGVFVVALLMTLLHQVYDEEKYFKGMFDQGRPFAIMYWKFGRWLVTFYAIFLIVAMLLDW